MMNSNDIKALEDKFYSQEFKLSYSGLNKLMYSPRLFYQWYILQEREEKIESYLIDGKVIHCMLLDNGSFDKQFIVSPSKLPTDNTRLVVDKVFDYYSKFKPVVEPDGSVAILSPDLEDHSTKILEILVGLNLHQSLKTDEQRIAKIITDETKSYFKFLLQKGSKDLLDEETYKRCKDNVDIIKNNKAISELMCLQKSDFELLEVYNEQYIETKDNYENTETGILYPFGLKGIVDNLVIDYTKKKIYINDLKTSSKTLADFSESISYYKYSLQAAIYKRLVEEKFKNEITSEWSIVFNFIVIDKYQQVCVFEISNDTMSKWQAELEECLKEAAYHYIFKNYTSPYKFITGKVTI